MQPGKIPPDIMQKTIFPYLGIKRKEVLVHSKLGEDCSIIDFGGDYVAVLSTDPITGADKHSSHLAVHISCNDIAACGAEPIGILITLLIPEGANDNIVRELMEGINVSAQKIGVEVLGGHSEVTSAVTKPIISTTAIGVAEKDGYITSSGAKPGNSIIVTKALGLEGTAILASDYEYYLDDKLAKITIVTAQNFIQYISVIPEGIIAAKNGATAMHDITEGGILGAAFEIAEASNVGLILYEDKLPILNETKEICNVFDIDPLGLISSGSMLICTDKPEELIKSLTVKNIPATIVGKIADRKRVLIKKDGTKIALKPPKRDELYKVLEKLK